MVLRDRNHPSIVIWGIGNEIPELEVEKGAEIGKRLADTVRALDGTRPLTLAFPGTTTSPTSRAVFSLLDITGYNYSLQNSYADDHTKLPSRIMLTTESFPAYAFRLWKISQNHAYVLGDLTWTAMDYLGESGIGAWSYGTPEQAQRAAQIATTMMSATTVDKMFLGMAKGVDISAMMSQGQKDPAMEAVAAVLFHGYPWHAAACGDIDLTGYRKPQSYYRDIIWNGGDRVYATVRLPEPKGRRIIAALWATYPTLPSWSWPGQEGKNMEVEVYSGAEKVQLFLNGKLIGEKPSGLDQEFKATFSVPYVLGTLKAVGLRGGRPVAESVLATAGDATNLRLTPDRKTINADGEDLSFVAVEAVDAQGRLQPNANQDVEFSINGPGMIAAVGNADGQDGASYQGNRRKLFQGRALVVVRTSKQSGPITVTAKTSGLTDGLTTIQTEAVEPARELN
jgi:beta-galactosidase